MNEHNPNLPKLLMEVALFLKNHPELHVIGFSYNDAWEGVRDEKLRIHLYVSDNIESEKSAMAAFKSETWTQNMDHGRNWYQVTRNGVIYFSGFDHINPMTGKKR